MELAFAVAGTVLTYLVAKNRGRSAWWALLGWIGLVVVLVLPARRQGSKEVAKR